MSTIEENPSTELAITEKPAETSQLITIEPTKYVELVFAPFKTKLAAAIAADAEVKFDIQTTAGMAIAVKRRALFRDEIRIATEAARKERKAPILEIGKLLDEKAKEIFVEAKPFETKYDDAITAEAARKEEIKAAIRRAEEARQAVLQAKIDEIKNNVVIAAGMDSGGIDQLSVALDFREVAFDEFGPRTGEASLAKSQAIEKLSVMHDQALAREQEAARAAAQLEADRIERERVAEANRVEAERLAQLNLDIEARALAARAEEERITTEANAKRAAADKEASDRRAEEDRIAAEARAAEQARLNEQAAALAAQQKAADKIVREAREAEEARVAAERAEADRIEREARESEQARLDAEATERRRAEQEAIDAARAAEEAAHAAEKKVRDAAPMLLAALQMWERAEAAEDADELELARIARFNAISAATV